MRCRLQTTVSLGTRSGGIGVGFGAQFRERAMVLLSLGFDADSKSSGLVGKR